MEATKKMIIVKNSSTKVLAFKANNEQTLRLFPGMNNIDFENKKDLDCYVRGNKAAKAMWKEFCEIITGDLSEDEKKTAEKAKTKNKKLNKGGK